MEPGFYLSEQAIACIMIALQKALIQDEDIVPMLKNMQLVSVDGELQVTNPPEPISAEILEELANNLPKTIEVV